MKAKELKEKAELQAQKDLESRATEILAKWLQKRNSEIKRIDDAFQQILEKDIESLVDEYDKGRIRF